MTTTHVGATTPLESALFQLDRAAERIGLSEGMREMLARPRREMLVAIPLRRDDGRIEMLTGYRVQHNVSRGPAKGGVRFAPGVDLEEVRARFVDDLEMRPDGRPLRWSEGRNCPRPAHLFRDGVGTRYPSVCLRARFLHRPGSRHPRTAHRHRRTDDGVDDGHDLGFARSSSGRIGNWQATCDRRLAWQGASDFLRCRR